MRSTYYIRNITGLGLLALAACAETPIAKTNCWTPPTVTASARGMAPGALPVAPPEAPVSDVQPCK